MSIESFGNLDRKAELLQVALEDIGVSINPGGALEDLCLLLKELADFHQGKLAPERSCDLRPRFRRASGFNHLASLILAVKDDPQLRKMSSHLNLLNRGTPTQNTPALANDPSANKTFELLMALAAIRIGSTCVELDDPDNSRGDNPDILADFDGETWGLACKVPGGDAPETLFERIKEGIEQIERSRATRGFVTLNFKNRFDHDSVMPDLGRDSEGDILLGTHRDEAELRSRLKRYAEERLKAMAEHATEPILSNLFVQSKALPAALVVSQTTAGVRLPPEHAPPGMGGAPAVTFVGFLHFVDLEWSPLVVPSRFDAKTWLFLDKLNRALHV